MSKTSAVRVRSGSKVLPTYLPAAPDRNPMFLERRVYQGSSGKVYPLPFTDRIAERPVNRKWKAVWIENEFLRVLVLPEIGGRIHAIMDKSTGYDLIYNQPVIKPALVGLAGPWISGGIEFNWPQHHRPATFLPVDYRIERHPGGSATIWCSDHDPMARMKGMHGVCLQPGKAFVELKVRVHNRTPLTQTFLWWANVAVQVHEAYRSFFPPDVSYVADHARRSMTEYPLAKGFYYGVDYGERGRNGIPANEMPTKYVPPHAGAKSEVRDPKTERNRSSDTRRLGHSFPQVPDLGHRTSDLPDYAANDLSFYANIPVPTSYMCMGSKEDFFGGYDYKAGAGIVHVANHHLSPGKKQWTWGNHDFGYAWDRNLTDARPNGEFPPYIEIMAGVYTDNQPDFSFLQPGETKSWSQYWYPIHNIGPAQHANLNAAISLCIMASGGNRSAAPPPKAPSPLDSGLNGVPPRQPSGALQKVLRLGVAVTRCEPKALVTLVTVHGRQRRSQTAVGKVVAEVRCDLAPGSPLLKEIRLPCGIAETDLLVRVTDAAGNEIIAYHPEARVQPEVPPPATEPPAPEEIVRDDELFITGLHLDQYRHATRCPTLYWREALRRDPLDSRCNNALGLWHYKRGEFSVAEEHFRRAVKRLTRRNASPYDGEAHYHLGLTLRHLGRDDEAYDAIYKACWNQAWVAAGHHALAEIDCARQNWTTALEHLNRSLRFDADNLRTRNLKVIVLRKLDRSAEAKSLLRKTLALDPLDWWARYLSGGQLACDLQVALDIAHDCARAGLFIEAIELLNDIASRTNGEHSSLSPGGRGNEKHTLPNQSWGALPLVYYTLGWLEQQRDHKPVALRLFKKAGAMPSDYCFPARLEEIVILETAMTANPRDAKAPYYLGNMLYDRRRHAEAIELWEKSVRLDDRFSVVWRNLGIGYFNIHRKPTKARAAYDRAFKANPSDARLLYERDQLWKRLGEKPDKRLCELEKRFDLVEQRDDLTVELSALYNQVGRHAKALALVSVRNFQPWEGGEGGPLGQWACSHLALGRAALNRGDNAKACGHFSAALTAPQNLGEARHLLANQSDSHYWFGCALAANRDPTKAKQHWLAAATFRGDFQEMSVRAFSEMTYYSALAWQKLGRRAKARKLFRDLLAYGKSLQASPAKIDYFATSLPTMLLFDDDLQFRQETTALLLQAQALLGLGRKSKGRSLLLTVLKRDPNHGLAADLLSDDPH